MEAGRRGVDGGMDTSFIMICPDGSIPWHIWGKVVVPGGLFYMAQKPFVCPSPFLFFFSSDHCLLWASGSPLAADLNAQDLWRNNRTSLTGGINLLPP